MRGDAFRSRLVLASLLAVSLGLIVLDSRAGADPVTSGVRSAGEVVLAPVSAGVSAAARPVGRSYEAVRAAPDTSARMERLERRNDELTARLRARDRDAERSKKLDELLHLSGLGGYEIVPAQAVARLTPTGYADTATLDVGTRDGVDEDMTVVNGDGLVGRVRRAGPDTSTVLLVTDGSSVVGARLERSGEIGVAEGTAHAIDDTQQLRFELMDAEARMAKGQRIVTLGSHDDEPFVPGVPVGKVASVRNDPGSPARSAEIVPAADVSSLDLVGVVTKGPKKDPRDSVLPKPPKKTKAPKKPKKSGDREDGKGGRETKDSKADSGPAPDRDANEEGRRQ